MRFAFVNADEIARMSAVETNYRGRADIRAGRLIKLNQLNQRAAKMQFLICRTLPWFAILLATCTFALAETADRFDPRTVRIVVQTFSNLEPTRKTVFDDSFTVDLKRPYSDVTTEDRQIQINGKTLKFRANIRVVSPLPEELFSGETRTYIHLSATGFANFDDEKMSLGHKESMIEYNTDKQLVSRIEIYPEQTNTKAELYTLRFWLGIR